MRFLVPAFTTSTAFVYRQHRAVHITLVLTLEFQRRERGEVYQQQLVNYSYISKDIIENFYLLLIFRSFSLYNQHLLDRWVTPLTSCWIEYFVKPKNKNKNKLKKNKIIIQNLTKHLFNSYIVAWYIQERELFV